MKVIKNNYNKKEISKNSYPRQLICEECSSELEYEESDLRMGALGCVYLDCPLCGVENMLEDNENTITLTKDNIEFPTHFWHISKECGAVEISDEEIQGYIRKGVEALRKNKNEFDDFYSTGTGNTSVIILRFDGDENYEVYVAKDYYHSYIPFEDEDYKDEYY